MANRTIEGKKPTGTQLNVYPEEMAEAQGIALQKGITNAKSKSSFVRWLVRKFIIDNKNE